MTNLFDLRLIGAMLYLPSKLSHSGCLFMSVRQEQREKEG